MFKDIFLINLRDKCRDICNILKVSIYNSLSNYIYNSQSIVKYNLIIYIVDIYIP